MSVSDASRFHAALFDSAKDWNFSEVKYTEIFLENQISMNDLTHFNEYLFVKMSTYNNMETTREKFNILANYSSLRPFICLCSKGLLHRRFQVEVFEEFFKELVGFFPVETEEADFKFFKVTPALDVLVVEVVVYAAVSSQ